MSETPPRGQALPSEFSPVSALGVTFVALSVDIFTPGAYYPPILYVIALALCMSAPDRRFIWGLTLAALALTFVGGLCSYPPANPNSQTTEFWINRAIVASAIVGIATIIHRHIALVEAYRRRSEELGVATKEIEGRRLKAEELSSRKTRFLAAISHDLRTPANAIRLLARVIREVRSDPTRVDDLTVRLESNTVILIDMLTDALDVARFDSDALMTPDERDFPLATVVEYVVTIVQPLAEAKRLRLVVEIAAGRISLRADHGRLARVIVNLLDNAIKFTDAGSVLLSATKTDDGGLRLAVRDTGRGIERGHLGDIFDEFVQIRRSDRDRVGGRGLGLATCKRLVVEMQGRLEVDSLVGSGTTFAILLPASRVTQSPCSPRLLSFE